MRRKILFAVVGGLALFGVLVAVTLLRSDGTPTAPAPTAPAPTAPAPTAPAPTAPAPAPELTPTPVADYQSAEWVENATKEVIQLSGERAKADAPYATPSPVIEAPVAPVAEDPVVAEAPVTQSQVELLKKLRRQTKEYIIRKNLSLKQARLAAAAHKAAAELAKGEKELSAVEAKTAEDWEKVRSLITQ